MDRPWLQQYPPGVPADVDVHAYASLPALLNESFARHAERPALRFMGQDVRYAQLDADSRALAAWLQAQGLVRGDRVALMMPNVPQYAVAVAAVLRAGLVVVNVNPLYTARELEHQLKDSGARAIVILENFAATLEQVLPQVPTKAVLLASMGDMLGPLKGAVVNHVVRRIRQLVPAFRLPEAVRWREALAAGRRGVFQPPTLGPDDIAVLQYTGGTTGVSKGAVLLHRNLVANMLQSEAWNQPALAQLAPAEQYVNICALPLYHIFAFTTCLLLGIRLGGLNVLIPNPRDLPATIKALAAQRFHSLPAVNTLFQALAHHPDIAHVDFGALKVCIGGGMAVQSATARLWLEKTGCPIVEGYGLSETSPSATCNPVDSSSFTGTIGLPLPGTDVMLLDDHGHAVPPGTPGEIAIRGPQVMAGYWQRPDETAKVMTADGFFRTGDIGTMDARGWLRIVDRKKDMILVSGFNVYPNEVEDVITQMPGVLECAAVGVPDPKAGEAVKVVVVKQDPAVTEHDIRAFCEANLTGYKRPKLVEFRAELPKTPVGKILRRELRDAA
ncbi:long-chain-fatty-acid--CoA ligase [Rubrivivax albus]|uniref:Long-chain-fatty-acid--CoA ligase n=1 Tax=Rubrivivax albus TaxID=2499835 RepID=A0A437JY02_9BURK|nr:long-chain-fatty-acid--CoA ligase [Rubrivivax albus]RVT52544.1 long-chain-fatty-acid--CoA ligase [Rubrivivax albus]